MRVLHTSDWHIGHQFHNRKRDDEFAAFLNWILNTVKERRIDALIVAGDVFDSSAPPNSAVRLYYEFLRELQATPCRAAVITGGNHDSPSFLNAPRELLRSAFPIYIFGSASPNRKRKSSLSAANPGNRNSSSAPFPTCATPTLSPSSSEKISRITKKK